MILYSLFECSCLREIYHSITIVVLFAILSVLISSKKKNGFQFDVNAHKRSPKDEECGTKPDSAIDISEQTSNNQKIIYGCKKSFNSRLEQTNSRLLIYSCQFHDISSTIDGGAIYYRFDEKLTSTTDGLTEETIIQDCLFENCKGSNGGAIYFYISNIIYVFINIKITRTKFIHCTSTNRGGAIYQYGNIITFDGCEFNNNLATIDGNDFYFKFFKYFPEDINEEVPQQGITFTGCRFTDSAYNSKSMIYAVGDDFYIVFKGNTILLKATDQESTAFSAINLEEANTYDQYQFEDNKVSPFDMDLILSDKIKDNQKIKSGFSKSTESYDKCGTPPDNYQDISIYEEPQENKNIYGCHGVYSHNIIITKSRMLLYHCTFNQVIDNYYDKGGAVYISKSFDTQFPEGDLIFDHCLFNECQVNFEGSALYFELTNFKDNVLVTNCTFSHNVAKDRGCICMYGNKLTVDSCRFIGSGNHDGDNFYKGRDISFDHKDFQIQKDTDFLDEVLIQNCTFDGELKDIKGGSVYVRFPSGQYKGKVLIENCIFENNFGSEGASIFIEQIQKGTSRQLVPTLINSCIFKESKIIEGISGKGGAIYFNYEYISKSEDGIFEIDNCTFENNEAYEGGSIATYQKYDSIANLKVFPIKIKNCDFKQCISANAGGAIYLFFSNRDESDDFIEIENCTFVGCQASNFGGGAFYISQNAGDYIKYKITNSTFKENKDTTKASRGGAIYSRVRCTIIEDCHFINNYAAKSNDIYIMIHSSSSENINNDIIMINNEFTLSSDTKASSLIELDLLAKLQKCNFENNQITISGATLESTGFYIFSIFSKEYIPTNHKNNFLSPCNKDIIFNDRFMIDNFNFDKAFPNCLITPTQEPTEPQVEETTDTQVEETTDTQVEETTDTQLEETTESQVEETTESQVEETTESQVEETTDTQVEETTESQVEETTDTQIEETTDTQVEETTDTQTKETTEPQVEETTEPQVEEPIDTQTKETTEPQDKDPTDTPGQKPSDPTNHKTPDLPVQDPTESVVEEVTSSNNGQNPEDVNIIGNNNKKGKPLEIWMILLIAAAALIIIAVIIIIIVLKRRKAEKENQEKIDAFEETVQDDTETGIAEEFNNPLYANKQNDQFDPFDREDDDDNN